MRRSYVNESSLMASRKLFLVSSRHNLMFVVLSQKQQEWSPVSIQAVPDPGTLRGPQVGVTFVSMISVEGHTLSSTADG